jgi:hypothetical protein
MKESDERENIYSQRDTAGGTIQASCVVPNDLQFRLRLFLLDLRTDLVS